MVTTKHTCNKCQSENIVLNGKNKSGSQTYKCNHCGIYRVLFRVKKTKDIDLDTLKEPIKNEIAHALQGKYLELAM